MICLSEVLFAVAGLLNREITVLASCFRCRFFFYAVKGRTLFIEKEVIVLYRIISCKEE